MPKRQNPFGEHFSQLKTHVGEKEVNMGVAFHDRMKAVYDRTMALLFDGQKHMMNSAQASSSSRDTAPSPGKADNPALQAAADLVPDWAQAQYTLDSQGHLSTRQPNTAMFSNAGQSMHAPSSVCTSCRAGAVLFYGSCSFCDGQICSQCCRECCSCQGVFCSLCSVINYDESLERPFCLNCSET